MRSSDRERWQAPELLWDIVGRDVAELAPEHMRRLARGGGSPPVDADLAADLAAVRIEEECCQVAG